MAHEESRQNLIVNPIKALTNSGYFFFNQEKQELIFSPELWPSIGHSEKYKSERSVIKDLQSISVSNRLARCQYG